MDDFERRVIEAAIRSRVGEIERIDHCTRTHRTLMNVILDVAERKLPHPTELFWIDDGIPGHFCMNCGGSSAVVFHGRELLLVAYLRSLYQKIWGPGIREAVSKRLALRLVSEFLLQRGFVDQALQTYTKSTFDTGVTISEPTISDLEHAPLGEEYLVTWFFGLAHELGHFLAPGHRDALRSLLGTASGRIAGVVDGYINMRFPEAKDAETLKAIIRRNDAQPVSKCYASAGVLENEVIADFFSLQTLCDASPEFFSPPERLSGHSLLLEIIIAANSLMLIDQCRILAGWFTNLSEELEEQNLTMSNVALGTRINLLIGTFLNPNYRDRLGEEQGINRVFDDLDPNRLRAELLVLDQYNIEIGRGIEFAREFVSSPEMRDTSLFYGLLDRLRGDGVLVGDTQAFVALGRNLAVRSPQFELLANAVK